MWFNLVIFILICYGMTQILIYGKIFDKVRPKWYLFKCPMCLGFHVGWIVYLLMQVSYGYNKAFEWFLMACISSGTTYFLCSAIDDFGIKVRTNFFWD